MLNSVRKIKTFRFVGSKNEYIKGKGDNNKLYTSESIIDHSINQWLADNNAILIDIKINTIETNYHNNCGYNQVDLLYTIIYE